MVWEATFEKGCSVSGDKVRSDPGCEEANDAIPVKNEERPDGPVVDWQAEFSAGGGRGSM